MKSVGLSQTFNFLSLLFLNLTILSNALIQQPPVIGIISTPRSNYTKDYSLIKTAYAEYAEAGGATVIPLPWNVDDAKFNTLLESVNGVLFTGGTALLWQDDKVTGKRKYSKFLTRLKYIVDLVKQKKKDGITYPLWAVCQGFEALSLITTEDFYILDKYDHFGKLSKIDFTPEAAQSTLFQYFTQDSFEFLQNYSVMYYYHQYGLNMSVPSLYPAFGADKWRVLGTSKDDNGKEFIAAMESKEYPIYMAMFHPERIVWEANNLAKAKHMSGAVYAARLMAKSFIAEASKNDNYFENRNLLSALVIENFEPTELEYGLYYTFNKRSLDSKWEAVLKESDTKQSEIFWIVLLAFITAFIMTAYCVYKNFKRKNRNHQKFNDSVQLELKSMK